MAEYIDRGTAIAKVTALEVVEPLATMVDVKRLLADMPAADVAPVRHGRREDIVESVSVLSETGFHIPTVAETCTSCRFRSCFVGPKDLLHDYNCPNCGAKMDGGADNG